MNIYKITNLINNKIYIGLTKKSIESRFYHHKYTATNGKGYYLHNSMRKYGVDNFEIELLDWAEDLKTLKEKEIFYIKEYKTTDPNYGYNLTLGGDGVSVKNENSTCIKTPEGNNIKIPLKEFYTNINDYTHIHKGFITVFNGSDKIRITSEEYKNVFFGLGWRSKNFHKMNVIDSMGNLININKLDYDPEIHSGVNKGKQRYYNCLTNKYDMLYSYEVDENIYYNKDKVKYYIYNSDGKLLQTVLDLSNINIENGFKQFRYMWMREKNFTELIITEEILNKLKLKNRNYLLIGNKLIKHQL